MANVFYMGDSTVAFNKIDSYPQTGMSQGLARYVKDDVIIRPFGKNGRSTKSFIDEGWFEQVCRVLGEGDILIIQFGHNDEKPDEARHTEPFGGYQENLLRFINAARAVGAHPVLVTPIARRLFDSDGTFMPGSHGQYPEAMRQLGQREGVPVADLTAITEGYLAQVGDLPSKPWFMWPKDNTHLKPEGAVIMAGFLASELKKMGSPYADILEDFSK